MLLSHPPNLIRSMYPSLLWKVETKRKEIFITFDDGPTKGVTDLVLKELRGHDAKATFFCLGKNVEEEQALFHQIVKEGHAVGNHTYDHLNGWKNKTGEYLDSIDRCNNVFKSHLFRPPYGRIKPSQIKTIRKKYKIVMWSILSMDYDPMVTKEKSLELSVKDLKPGAIVVFHDSLKAKDKMLFVLKELLTFCKKNGIICSALS